MYINAHRGGGAGHHGGRHARHRAAPHGRHGPSNSMMPDHHPENAASGIIEPFERLLKRGYGHHHKHEPWGDLEPAEFCNAVLCKEEAKSCAEELGCHDAADACKEACPEGDRSCCQTCKATFETCAADCLAAEDVCLEEGHPDVDMCTSCFDEAAIERNASNSTICVKVMEYKKSYGKRGSSDSMDYSISDSMSMSMDSSSDAAASSSSTEESTGTLPVTGEVIGISAVVGLCVGALAYAVKRSMKVQQDLPESQVIQPQLTEVDIHEGVPVKQLEP